jgi:predicted nucleic acid-binding protein
LKNNPDDGVILETAIVGKVDCIVTGDPHLLKLVEFTKVKIVTANEFLEI